MGTGLIRKQKIPSELIGMARSLRKVMTPAEQCFWSAVRGRKLNGLHFRRQQWMEGFIADFYCEKLKLVVEVDGGVHERQKGYDRLRNAAIRKLGLQVMRFTNEEVMHRMDGVMSKIMALTLPSGSVKTSLPRSPSPYGRGG